MTTPVHSIGLASDPGDRVSADAGLASLQQGEPRRRSGRLRGYDYSTPGAYFITVCTQNRLPLFGEVENGDMEANGPGSVVEECWTKLPDHYDNLVLDAFILMPNHVHGVIILEDGPTCVGAGFKPALPAAVSRGRHGVPEIVRAFKTFSARKINEMRASTGTPVWQRGFYDHVIRNQRELDRVRAYVIDNPRRWDEDVDNPVNWPGRGRVSKPFAPTNCHFSFGKASEDGGSLAIFVLIRVDQTQSGWETAGLYVH